MILDFIKDLTIRKYWWMNILWNRKETFLVESGWTLSYENKIALNKEGQAIPWISYPLYKYLDQLDISNLDIFEYGIGSSTEYFSQRAKAVSGIEHNNEWYNFIERKNFPNTEIQFAELGIEYVESIRKISKKFDIIIIDGRMRSECLLFSQNYLSNGGVLILDDSHRTRYKAAIDKTISNGFKNIPFWGFGNGSNELKSSTLFYKESNCLSI